MVLISYHSYKLSIFYIAIKNEFLMNYQQQQTIYTN